jgi:uncharacterized membrane protein
MKRLLLLCGAVTAAAALTACDDTINLPVEDASRISADYCGVEELMAGQCTDCHSASGGTYPDLGSDLHAAVVDVESANNAGEVFVIPGDSAGSFLYTKCAGTSSVGSKMPLGGDVSEANLAAMATWIDNGATTDCDASAKSIDTGAN